MEHIKEQKEMFEDEPTESSKQEERKSPPVKKEEILLARPVFEAGVTLCAKCSGVITAGDEIAYAAHFYHRGCAPFATGSMSLSENPRLEVNFTARASEIAHLLETIELDSAFRALHDHLADVLVEHDNSYIRCTFCGKVILRSLSVQAHTVAIKKETGAIIAVQSGKFYSKVRSVELFCSDSCDLNYSKQLKVAWELEQSTKAAKKAEAKKADGLTQLFKIAKTNKEAKAAIEMILQKALAEAAAMSAGKKPEAGKGAAK